MDKLEPCPFCGGEAECDSQQAFRALSSGKVGTRFTIYCTSCNADMGYCHDDIESANHEAADQEIIAAWNQRTRPHPTGEVGEVVERLLLMADQGDFGRRPDPADIRRQAAALLTSLSAKVQEQATEIERLHQNAKANNDLARMYKAQADEFRAKWVALAGDPP